MEQRQCTEVDGTASWNSSHPREINVRKAPSQWQQTKDEPKLTILPQRSPGPTRDWHQREAISVVMDQRYYTEADNHTTKNRNTELW